MPTVRTITTPASPVEDDEGDDDGAPGGWASEQPLVVILLRRPDREPVYSLVLRRGTLGSR